MYEIGDQELEELRKLFQSKKLFRYQGKDVETESTKFEREFSAVINSPHSLLLTSGTNALLNGIKSLGIGEGDEILIPAFTFVATPAAVIQSGATPVLVNIDENLSLCPEDLKKKISPRAKAIIPVHMDGLTCEMDSILKIAREHKLFLIEDVAQAIGGSYKGGRLGSFGDVGCYSFNVDKIISCGEGGALVCKDEAVYKKALMFHDVGVSFGASFKDYLAKEAPLVGISMRASEISAAIMRVQLRRLDEILGRLRQRKNIFRKAFEENGLFYTKSHDQEGDCGTSFHFSVSDPLFASLLCKKLLSAGLKAMPTGARPAHSYWQWIEILGIGSERKRALQQDLAQTKMILSSNIKVFIEIDKSLEETEALAMVLVKELRA